MDRTSYDSTWEEDDDDDDDDDDFAELERSTNNAQVRKNTQAPLTAKIQQNGKPIKFRYEYMYSSAARDMQNYRHGYWHSGPSHRIDSEEMPNLHFYRNKLVFKPNGYLIEDFLNAGKDDYDMLEYNHNYIQWLFPLQERGVNPNATPLHKKEIQEMKKDRRVMKNLLEAYKLMLGFYGLHLGNEETGEVCRAGNWEERFRNLNNHTHNRLRITRILKCLGELGFGHFQAPLVQFFLEETLCEGQLKNVKQSVLDYFMFSVKDKKKRQDLVRFAWKHYEPQSRFVWGPVDFLRNHQEVLKGRKRGNCDSIKNKYGEEDNKEDEKRPQKFQKNNQDGVKERGNVQTSRFVRGPVDLLSNDQEALKGRKRGSYDSIKKKYGEEDNKDDEKRPQKIQEKNQDGVKERGNVQTSGCARGTWRRLTRSLRRKSLNVMKKHEEEPMKYKPVNREEKVTSQGITRKRSRCINCLPF